MILIDNLHTCGLINGRTFCTSPGTCRLFPPVIIHNLHTCGHINGRTFCTSPGTCRLFPPVIIHNLHTCGHINGRTFCTSPGTCRLFPPGTCIMSSIYGYRYSCIWYAIDKQHYMSSMLSNNK